MLNHLLAKLIIRMENIKWAIKTDYLRSSLKKCGHHVKLRRDVTLAEPHKIEVGSYVDIGENSVLMGQGGIQIGDYCLIANNSILTTATHKIGGLYFNNVTTKKITLESNVWVGCHATILPGVTIGKNSIVAAGAVVNRDVPPNTVVAGVPAKAIKTIDFNSADFEKSRDALTS